MNECGKYSETFIIENPTYDVSNVCANPQNIIEDIVIEGEGYIFPSITASTGVYTNHIYSYSGDSAIHLLSGQTIFNKPIIGLEGVSATTYYGDGSNLTGIHDYYVTGGTNQGYNVILTRNDGVEITYSMTSFVVQLSADTFTTGGTFQNNVLTFRTSGGIAYSVPIDTFTSLTVTNLLSADTIYTTNLTAVTSVNTNLIKSHSGDSQIELTSGLTIFNTSLEPNIDNIISLGNQLRRFRDINTVSGYSTIWSSTTINVTNLNLGNDSLGNNRTITADNSVLQNDYLNGGVY